jgi:hypothetical protein
MRKIKELELKIEEFEQSIWGLEHPPKFKNGDMVNYNGNILKVVTCKLDCRLPYGFCYYYTVYDDKDNQIYSLNERELILIV